jgi:hypothetical protein
MADLGGVFDSDAVAPMGDRTPIPTGDYRCVCVKSDWKNTSKGGKYLEFTWQVLEGEHSGRMVWSRLNLQNSSSVAVEIARAELSSICKAVGVVKLRDSIEVHNVPLMVSVAVKKREDNGDLTNEVAGYKSVRLASESKQPAMAGGASVVGADKPAWM